MTPALLTKLSESAGAYRREILLLREERKHSRWKLKLALRADCHRLLGNTNNQFKWMKPKKIDDQAIPVPLAHFLNEKTEAELWKWPAPRLFFPNGDEFTTPFTRLLEFLSLMFLPDLVHFFIILSEYLLKKKCLRRWKRVKAISDMRTSFIFVTLQRYTTLRHECLGLF